MALSSKLKAAIKKAAGKYKKTKAADGGGFNNENVPDGSYSANLTGGEIKEIGGKAAVVLTFTIAEDEDEGAGETVSSRYFLETAENLSYLKRDLGKFVDGADEMDLDEELESTLAELVEASPDCRISVRMKDEFQNVYLNKVDLEDADEEDDEDEDDKPAKKKKGAKTASGGKGGKKGGKKSAKDEEDEEDEEDDADEDEEDEEDEAPEISKGDSVYFKPPRAKKAKVCKVVSVKGSKAKLEDEDGNEYPGILLSVLEPADEEDDADEDEEDEEDEAPKGKKGGKGKGKKSSKDEDEEDEEDDADEVDLEVGSKVVINYKGKEANGTVKAINEDDETVKVRFKLKGEFVTKTVSADQVEAA